MNEQIVYLIRHGSPRYPVDQQGRKLVCGPTAGLTDEGRVNSERLACRILQREGSPLEILVTSPIGVQNKLRQSWPVRWV